MLIPELTKRPTEKFPIGLKYVSPDLSTGETIVACVVTIDPVAPGGLVALGAPILNGDTVTQMIQGGADGHEYYVKFDVTISSGYKFEDAIFIKVRDIE